MTNIANTELNADTAILNAGTEAQSAEVQTVAVTETVTTGNSVAQSILEMLATEAGEKANRLTPTSHISDMVVDRITNADYDLRQLPVDFADVALNVGMQFASEGILYTFSHAQNVKRGDSSALKTVKYVYLVTVEKYDTGRTHPNGDPIKAFRYTAQQLGRLSAKAALLDTKGEQLKTLRRLAKKSEAGKLTKADTELLAMYEGRGIKLDTFERAMADSVTAAELESAAHGRANA